MKATSTATAKRPTPAVIFRKEIEGALQAGAKPKSLTLRLTGLDASHLKRDRTLAVSDISFTGGEMRFLGVKVEQDGVEVSELVRA